jgi:hypothetical protein
MVKNIALYAIFTSLEEKKKKNTLKIILKIQSAFMHLI